MASSCCLETGWGPCLANSARTRGLSLGMAALKPRVGRALRRGLTCSHAATSLVLVPVLAQQATQAADRVSESRRDVR